MSIAVSNTSPLVAFSAIGRLDLFENIFAPLLIPPSVGKELFPSGTVWREARPAQEAITRATWLQVEALPQGAVPQRLFQKLGAGEAEAILGTEAPSSGCYR